MQSSTLVSRDDPLTLLRCLPLRESPLAKRLSLAAELFGNNVAWMLFGFAMVQTYTYHRCSAKDPIVLKMLVYGLGFIMAAERAVDSFVSYGDLVSGWGNPLANLAPVNASIIAGNMKITFAALPAIFVQFFFTWRIWTFCMAACGWRMKLVIAAVCFFIVCTSFCALVSAITLYGVYVSPVFYPAPFPQRLSVIWTVSTAAVDLTITIIMIIILYHAKSSAYFGEARDRISRLLRLTLQTGFLTSMLFLPIAPLYLTNAQDVNGDIYSLTVFLLGGSYFISLLANLNARSYHPTSPNHARGIDSNTISHVSSLRFAAGQPQDRDSDGERTTGSGILSLIRSVVHTIHGDPTKSLDDRTLRMEREAQVTNVEGNLSGNTHAKESASDVVQV